MTAELLAHGGQGTDGGRAPRLPAPVLQYADDDLVRTLPIGARAPAFDGLLGVDGQRHGLAELVDATAVVLIFTANRCPTAKSYAERLRALQADYGPRGVQLVLINSNDAALYPEESFPRMVERSKADRFTFPYLRDADQAVARAYGPRCTFHVFLLDRGRRLRYEGRFDDARLADRVTSRDLVHALDAVLAGRPVQQSRTEPFGCSLDLLPAGPPPIAPRAQRWLRPSLLAVIGGSWLGVVATSMTGSGAMLNHDALIEGAIARGAPLAAAAPLAVASWLVMVGAMMLPASWDAIARFERIARRFGQPGRELAAFLAVFAAGWAFLGVLAFAGDAVVHRVVDATPWLASRPWLIQASILLVAAAYQLSPVKRRCLEGCRTRELAPAAAPGVRGDVAAIAQGASAGWAHLLDCIGASGPLMVLMFAAGFADLAWMAGLTLVMVYEARGSRGDSLCRLVAAGLAVLAVLAIAG